MDRLDPSPEQRDVLRVIDELISFLRTWGEDDLASRVDQDRRLLADGHPDAMGRVAGSIGGLGRLRELAITAANGHDIEPSRERATNDRLRTLRGAVATGISNLQAETPSFDD